MKASYGDRPLKPPDIGMIKRRSFFIARERGKNIMPFPMAQELRSS